MWRVTVFATIVICATFAARAPAQVDEIPLNQVLISLERTECFGKCPAYSVTIYGDGQIAYEGRRNVAQTGSAQARVSTGAVIDLVNRLLAARFFELPASYIHVNSVRMGSMGGLMILTGSIVDVPDTILRLKLGDRDHSILLRYKIPTDLRDLARAVDELAGTAKWVKGAGK